MDPTPKPLTPADGRHPHPPADPGHLPPEPMVPTPRDSVGEWARVNGWKLAVMVGLAAFVCWKFYWADVLLAAVGLGGMIFLHELGHFLAAKLCNVYVRTFSIGFGPAWPFCQFKFGETNYKVGMIPLGGYVAMAGEATGETDPDAPKDDVDDDTDPRSFKNRPVWQRMIIISAGVVMNVILAAVLFVAAYLHGVKEMPPVVQAVEPGSAAWQAGVRPGTTVDRINGIDRPWFADIPPEVSSTHKGDRVHLETTSGGQPRAFDIEPIVAEGAYYPTLGLTFPQGVQLEFTRRDPLPPFAPDTPAHKANEAAEKAGGPVLLPGDTVVGMTDPATGRVTPLEANWDGRPGATFDFRRRLSALAGKPIALEVQRLDGGERATVTVPAAFRQDTGLRMTMGQIAAVRAGSAADGAGFATQKMDGVNVLSEGDVITRVVAGGVTLFDPADPTANDPLRLPFELNKWAAATPGERAVSVTVRPAGGGEPRTVPLAWDDAAREDGFQLGSANTPVPLGGLGLAYRVSNVVAAVVPGSGADKAGLKAGDVVTDVRFNAALFKKQGAGVAAEPKSGAWDVVKAHHWGHVDFKLQVQPPHSFEFKADRDGVRVEGTLTAAPDETWGVPWTGLNFTRHTEVQQASNVGEALELGARRTARSIKQTYQNLYGMIIGRISPFTMSGPITLAEASYRLAGEDVWTLVILLGLISINLAVVNFLPIPVLDGGHMVFLLYEAVFRKPAPVLVQNILTIAGLVAVLCLMAFTIGLDVYRKVFGG